MSAPAVAFAVVTIMLAVFWMSIAVVSFTEIVGVARTHARIIYGGAALIHSNVDCDDRTISEWDNSAAIQTNVVDCDDRRISE